MNPWSFEMNQKVELSLSGEKGIVKGRAEYTDRPQMYYVKYIAADGRQVDGWFDREDLKA